MCDCTRVLIKQFQVLLYHLRMVHPYVIANFFFTHVLLIHYKELAY